MKWKVEMITENSSNILIDDPNKKQEDQEPVGMGFPLKLANRIVDLHNKAIEEMSALIDKDPNLLSKL